MVSGCCAISDCAEDPSVEGVQLRTSSLTWVKTPLLILGKKGKLRGTDGPDELTGTKKKKRIYGFGGDDRIRTEEGKYKVFGGDGADTFETLNGGKGHMKIMDFEAGDTITFCGCASTRIEQRGKNAWIVKGDDVKAVVKGVDANDLDIDFTKAVITMNADPMA